MANNTDYDVPTYLVKPPTLGKWESIRKTIWNSDTKQFMGRTAGSWGGILFFYLVFYAALSALFAICMQGLFYTLNNKSPAYQGGESLIGSNPGMGFRPIAKDVETVGSLIWYEASKPKNIKEWTDNLDEYLSAYTKKGDQNQMICDYNSRPRDNKVCAVNVSNWSNCSAANNYGYNSSSPCFFIKLNKIYGWVPDYYKKDDPLPEEMPEELKNYIGNVADPDKLETVWVSCHGENPADKENIGELKYYPEEHGFAGFYYPYTNIEGYLSPLVAVRMVRPTLHVLINIECRAWAKNIRYAKVKNEREGSVHLEMMID